MDRSISAKVVDEERRGYIEHSAEIVESAGGDTIDAALVFLHLLEADAKGLAEFLLAHAQEDTTQADSSSDMNIDGIGSISARGLGFGHLHHPGARHLRLQGESTPNLPTIGA
jgi:hypothetical protein